jgi:hypothetical protein
MLEQEALRLETVSLEPLRLFAEKRTMEPLPRAGFPNLA